MKITDLWKSNKKPTISFELFPPKTEKAAENLNKAIDKMVDLEPDFVSVTFGAGGSTREGSYELLKKLKNEKHLETIAYFAGYGLGPEDINQVLDRYRTLGIENILVVRGDKPRDETFVPHPDSLQYASDLITYIRPKYGFCMGAAGYPEGHIDAESKEKDIDYLKLKVEQGAEYIICNYFYDTRYFFEFLDRCRNNNIHVPILPGIMPIYSKKMMTLLANLCGATITEHIHNALAKIPDDDKEALVNFGIEFSVRQCKELLDRGVNGLHFYTMDRSRSVVEIVNRLRTEGSI